MVPSSWRRFLTAAGSVAVLATMALGQVLPSPPPPLPTGEFAARRAALAAAVANLHPGERVVVLVRGAEQAADMGPFVQDQDFLYLAGVAEPELALLLAVDGTGTGTVDELLVPPFSPFSATWDGKFLAPGAATAEKTGFRVAGNVRSLVDRLDQLLAPVDGRRPILRTPTSPAARTGSTPTKAAEAAKERANHPLDGRPSREEALVAALSRRFPDLTIAPLEPVLHPLRARKSEAELQLIAASTAAACEAIAEAMRSARPGLYEYHLAAVARYVLSLHGCGTDAYAAIVGAGANGCILHYSVNSKQLLDGDLIVMDYAATLHGYASDVTRTFPANGKFTPAQRRLVEDVHAVQQELIAAVKPGVSLNWLRRRCSELLVQKGYRVDHGPSHHVGLAVHDPSVDVLAEGMVITVEPGAYLRDQGMGCRIEDVVLVTGDGHRVLSDGVPSQPDAIEALMQQRGLVDVPLGNAKAAGGR